MKRQVLSPTMEYGKEADFSSQMFGVGSDGGQGLGRGTKQNVVDGLFVLVSDGSDLFGDGEDDMEIVRGEERKPSSFNPPTHRLSTFRSTTRPWFTGRRMWYRPMWLPRTALAM